MLCLHFLIALSFLSISCAAKTIKKTQENWLTPWQGLWFPHAPYNKNTKSSHLQSATTTQAVYADDWKGGWFPHKPVAAGLVRKRKPLKYQEFCDDGVHNLHLDYDATDVRQNFNHLCLSSNRSVFEPNMTRHAVLTEHFLPVALMPSTKCLNQPIGYTQSPPTNGDFRPLPAVYGSYKYIPPQRYLRNLAEGAIVMLYHPCAFQGQVEQLQLIVRSCLYRHIIAPTQLLTPERPLALLSWSKILTMSVVDKHIATSFIRRHARGGPLAVPNLSQTVEKRKTYAIDLLTEAHLVTDLDDNELCGYQEM